jgi:hypothetical protein
MQAQQSCNTAINESAIVVLSGKPGVWESRRLFENAVRKMSGRRGGGNEVCARIINE